jgi:hypothetical protein
LTFRYQKLQERQRVLEHKINEKISEDMYNVQQILEAMTKQSQEIDRQYDNNILHETNEKEEHQQQPTNNTINIDKEENTNITGYKLNANWYASLLMYNSY